MAEPTKRKKWSDVKARLEAFDRKGLVSLLGEVYDASVANRRFLHSRLTPGSRAIEVYRQLVADAIYPDRFSKRAGSASATQPQPSSSTGAQRAMQPGPSTSC
jgi:hypothetical protein